MVFPILLTELPENEVLRKKAQALAMLDAIVCRDWELRYHSFNSRWAPGEMLASMRNGSGDHYFSLFNRAGVILKGFAHESSVSLCKESDFVEAVPPGLIEIFSEPAFAPEETTFCIWRSTEERAWKTVGSCNDASDGSAALLGCLLGGPKDYRDWAENYYGSPLDLKAIQDVFNFVPLTQETVSRLNPSVSLQELASELIETGYPKEKT